MAPTLSFFEPHPSVTGPKRTAIGSGRGGAGNYASYKSIKLTEGASATGPANRTSVASTTSTQSSPSASTSTGPSAATTRPKAPRYVSHVGIGGAGNTVSTRAIFDFDEDLERKQRRAEQQSSAPVFHVGRGGAGNAFSNRTPAARRDSMASAGTGGSSVRGQARTAVEGLKGRVARAFARE